MNVFDVFRDGYNRVRNDSTLSAKHAPRTTSDFFPENAESVRKVVNFLKSPDKRGIVIRGPTGSGKTHAVALAVQEASARCLWITSLQKRTKKELKNIYENVNGYKDRVLVIDAIESFSKGESSGINEVVSWLIKNEPNDTKLVLIVELTNSNRLSDLAKKCEFVDFVYPRTDTLFAKCKEIVNIEQLDVSDEDVTRVILTFHNDPRSVFEGISSPCLACEKQQQHDMYTIFAKLVSDIDVSRKIGYFACEPCVVPVIFQENYIDWNLGRALERDASHRMAMGDIFHKQMFLSNNSTTVCNEMYACVSSVFNARVRPGAKFRFGSVWTKQSAMFQKKRYIFTIKNAHTEFMDTDSVLFLRDAVLSSNDEDLKELIRYYRYSAETLNVMTNIFPSVDFNKKQFKQKLQMYSS